jgi:hypothetical protein
MHGHTHLSKHKKRIGGPKELQYRIKGTEYAIVNSNKGDRFEVTIHSTNQIVMAKPRNSLSKGPHKERIVKGDMVLIQRDETTTVSSKANCQKKLCKAQGCICSDKYYIIHKYSEDDVKRLRKAGELAQVLVEKEKEDDIVFEDDIIDKKLDEIEIDDDFIANI